MRRRTVACAMFALLLAGWALSLAGCVQLYRDESGEVQVEPGDIEIEEK